MTYKAEVSNWDEWERQYCQSWHEITVELITKYPDSLELKSNGPKKKPEWTAQEDNHWRTGCIIS